MRIDSTGKLSITESAQGIQIGPDVAAYTIKRDSGGLLNFNATQSNFNGYIFDTADGERMRINSSGNLLVGTQTVVAQSTFYGQVATGTGAAIGIIDNEGDQATIGLTTAGNLYIKAEDGEVYAIDSSNNATVLSPHNFSLIPDGPSEELAWSYYSERKETTEDLNDPSAPTKKINVDMARVVRLVEQLSGETLIYTSED